jgi:IMP dehydrogenase/GMP reductase
LKNILKLLNHYRKSSIIKMRLISDTKLDFSDVLILPQRSELESRKDIDLEREFTFKHSKYTWKGVPIIVSNMDTTGTIEVALELQKYKMITCLHKFYKYTDIPKELDKNYYMVSTGIREQDLENLDEIMRHIDPIFICVDVANGYSTKFLEVVKQVREKYPTKVICAGNVVTSDMAQELVISGGVDIVKCGIGSGCFTSDTKVLMADGKYRNINKIKIGEKVINMRGEAVQVLNVTNQGYKNVISSKNSNWKNSTFVTPDHLYFTNSCFWKSIDSLNGAEFKLPENIKWELPETFSVQIDEDKYMKCNEDLGKLFGIILMYAHIKNDSFEFIPQNFLDIDIILRNIFQDLEHKSNKYLIKMFNQWKTTIFEKDSPYCNNEYPHEFYCTDLDFNKGLNTILKKYISQLHPSYQHHYEILQFTELVLNKTRSAPNSFLTINNSFSSLEETWDIEVDCDTHSFIADNCIVHNSVCTTRLQTGVGYPQLSCVIECSNTIHGLDAHIVSDGGIQVSGDISKAFGGGADFVMCGSMFAGHNECGGEIVVENGKTYKVFYGMSSSKAMDKYHGGVANYRSAEGKCVKIESKGKISDTVDNMLGGVRSTMTYIGAKKMKNLSKCCTFIKVNNQVNNIYK